MKRVMTFATIMIMAGILTACGKQNAEPIEGMINLGDEIDGMVFSTIEEYFFTNDLIQYCDLDNQREIDTRVYEIDCLATAGDQVFFGNCAGVGADSYEELDTEWSNMNAEVTFDGQAINLPPFGPIDFQPEEGYFRVWNLNAENISAGTHIIHCVVTQNSPSPQGNQPWDSTFTFTVIGEDMDYPTLSGAVTPGQHPYNSEETGLDFMLYLPEEYGEDPEQKWPLILYLHGYPKGLEHLEWIDRDGLPNILLDEENFPFIVVSPHRNEGYYEYWYQDENVQPLFQLVEEVQSLYAVDPQRIYLAGTSAGGNGVWEIGLQYPDRFAALIPVAGYYNWPYEVPDNICDLKDTPIWAFHGEEDERVPVEAQQILVDALEDCGGNAHITVFPDTYHNIDEQLVYTSELITWLLSHTLDRNE